eukprot:g1260.t1
MASNAEYKLVELKRITGNEKEELMDAFHKNIELMKSIVKLKKENERAQSGGATGRKEEDEEDAIGTIRTSCETIIKTCLEKDAFVEAITVVLDEYKNLDGVVQIDDDEEFFKDKSDDAIVNSMRFPKFDFATKVDSAFKKKLTEKKYQNVNGYRDKDGHLMMRQFEDAIKEPAEEGASKDGEIEFVGNHNEAAGYSAGADEDDQLWRVTMLGLFQNDPLGARTMTEKCFEKCIVKPGSQLTDREKRCLESCATNYNSTMTLVTGAVTKAGNQ